MLAVLEQDLFKFREQNDQKTLNPEDTAHIRGKIEYVKGCIKKLRDRITTGKGK